MPHGYLRRILHRQSQEYRVAEAKQEDSDVHDYFLHCFSSPPSLCTQLHILQKRGAGLYGKKLDLASLSCVLSLSS